VEKLTFFPTFNYDLKLHWKIPHNNETLLTSTHGTVDANSQVEYMEVEEELDSRNQFMPTKGSINNFEKSSKLNESFPKPILNSTNRSLFALTNTSFANLEKSEKSSNDVIETIFSEQNSTKKDNLEKTDESNKKLKSYQEMKQKLRPLVKISTQNSMHQLLSTRKS